MAIKDMPTPDFILYPIADALSLELNEKDGVIRGMAPAKLRIGPWAIPADIIAASNVLTLHDAGVFVKIVGNLWLYVVSTDAVRLVIYVVDNAVAKLHVKDAHKDGGNTVADTLKTLQKALVTAYVFNDDTKLWVENDVSNLVHNGTAKSAVSLITGPKSL